MNGIARFLKKRWVLYILLLTPILYLFLPQARSETEFQADPAKYLLEYIGLSATILFVIVLMITPLRKIFTKSSIIKALAFHRRQIGVSVFIYALLHLLIYFAYTGSWAGFVKDWEKLFILSGIIALVLLLVHRLAYLIMLLLIYHQATQEKTGYQETAKIFAPLLILQAYRIGLYTKRAFDQRSNEQS